MDFIGNGIIWPLLAWLVAGMLILAGAVAVDARERGQSAALWFLLALLFPGFGALAYLVLRPAETAGLPAISPTDRPLGGPERATSAPPGATPARESVPSARAEASAAPPARDLPAATAPAPRDLSPPGAAPPATTPRPEPARASAAEATHGGTMEWRRGVGVLPAAAAPPAAAPPEPQARPEPRQGGGVPPWLVGAGVAVLLLVVVGAVALPRLAPPSPPPATPTVEPSPTAPPSLDAAPAPLAAAEAPPERPSTYTVEEGDTLGGIAAQFDTSVQALMEANGIEDADTVFVGQRLTIPPP
ncbi:MAG TPA: LysM peptidoglycan-binding domain-containing protein [Chloroflexota bacterium]|nr:LysM peptidoglycan-binding domain-containing protein [Chloroflexota bacterium]